MDQRQRRANAGFTLLEVILVAGLMLVLVSTGIVMSTQALRNQEFGRTVELIRSEYAAAQGDAIAGTNATSWGIQIGVSSMTRFQGASYAHRNTAFDVQTDFSSAVAVTGTSSVIFQYPTGVPVNAGYATIQSNTASATVSVSRVGTIDVR